MSKKRKSNKSTSARGHVEGNVIRFREKTELIRVDRHGKPIKGKIPINTFDKDWFNKHLSDISAPPPQIQRRNPPPDNVTSIESKRKPAPSKPVPQSGNEARKQEPFKPVHGWLHNRALAINEFKHWERRTKEFGRERCGSELWHRNDNGKLSSPSLEKQRELSKLGHTKPKTKFKKPPSLVHNPFLKPDSGGYAPKSKAAPICVLNQRNRIIHGTEPLAPSGLPISEFVTGKYKPQEKAVVYTTPPKYQKEWPFVKQQAKPEPAPTASKHWYGTAANDSQMHTLDKARATRVSVQWFINHVEPQNWPSSYHDFVRWTKDGPVPNVGAINKAVNTPEDEIALLRATNEGLEKDWRMIDSALADAVSENNLLRQELELTQQERDEERRANNLMEYELSHRQGKSPEDVRLDYVVKSKTPQIPDDVDGMLFQYRMFQSFARVDGLEVAFARYVYGDPRLGEVMRDHADMRLKERQDAFDQREAERKAEQELKQAQAEFEKQQYDEYVNFWNQQYPAYLKQRARRRNSGAVRNPARESVALAAIARKGKPAMHKQSSLYYSSLDRDRMVTSAVAKHIIADVKPTRCRYNNPRLVEHDTRESWAQPTFKGISSYEKWWSERLDWCEVHYHEVKHPVKVNIVKSYNWLVDKLNTPVDPATRSRHAKLREQMREKQREIDEKREKRKEAKAAAKQRKAERDHIRKMQRLAH